MKKGHNSNSEVKKYAERLLNLDKEIADMTDKHVAPLRADRNDLYKEAKANGFNRKALKEIVREMKMDADLRSDLELYRGACLDDLME